jgi:hypothetical protein
MEPVAVAGGWRGRVRVWVPVALAGVLVGCTSASDPEGEPSPGSATSPSAVAFYEPVPRDLCESLSFKESLEAGV